MSAESATKRKPEGERKMPRKSATKRKPEGERAETPGATPPTTDEAAKTEKKASPTERSFSVELQLRHAMYVERLAETRGLTPERVIEWCVRQEYAKDPYKGGLVSSPSSVPAADGPRR